jgi:uncharacterized protein (TIGR02453 family)
VPPRFPGFPPEAFILLRDLKANNNRDWFQPRKSAFEELVKAPMEELVEAVNANLVGFAPDHVTEPKKAIYRIYRDTRFSSDKTPYKTHIGANFPRRGLSKHGGGSYYFHVSPDEVLLACGAYMPGKEELLAIRTYIAENHTGLVRILRKKRIRELMGEIQGEKLARPPKGFPKDHPADELLRAKQWYFYTTLDPSIAVTKDLLPALTTRFRVMREFVDFLSAALLAHRKADAPAAFFATGAGPKRR